MARFRKDSSKVNAFGQTEHYANWMGGPTLSAVEGVLCVDGKTRTAEVTANPGHYMSASVRLAADKSRGLPACSVTGHLSFSDSEGWRFDAKRSGANYARLPDVFFCKNAGPYGASTGIGHAVTFVLDGHLFAGRIVSVDAKTTEVLEGGKVKAIVPKLWVVCQMLHADNVIGDLAYVRLIGQEDIKSTRLPTPGGAALAAFLAGYGNVPSLSEVKAIDSYGSYSAAYFGDYVDYVNKRVRTLPEVLQARAARKQEQGK